MKLIGLSSFSGEGLKARSLRGAVLTIIAFGGNKVLRLASNLIMTRLLFPEAFGLMALVFVFISGLKMFSDTGIRTSIMQSARGDEPDFLNVAWTVQICRGVVLWLGTCALAWPVAALYGEPMLIQLLPVTGLTLIIAGLTTTKVASANRHLMLGRITAINLGTQLVGMIITIALAYLLRSVWALVIGALVTTTLSMLIEHRILPGISNRLHWDREIFLELFQYGKFIFLSTAVTFMITQGDKAILGGYVSLAELGIYNIGYFLGSVPLYLSQAGNNKVVFPLYRIKPIAENPGNRAKVFKARRLVIAACLGLSALLAYSGIVLVEFLYDPRYHLAGPIVVLLSLTVVPQVVMTSYVSLLLASGDSKRVFILNMSTALIQTSLMFAGVIWFGIFGILAAPPVAFLLTHPMRVRYVRRYGGWDGRGDLLFLGLGFVINGFACWLYWDDIVRLIG